MRKKLVIALILLLTTMLSACRTTNITTTTATTDPTAKQLITVSATYDMNDTGDFTVTLATAEIPVYLVSIDGTDLSLDDFSESEGILTITKDFLEDFESDSYSIYAYSDEYNYKVTLTLSDSREPEITSDASVTYHTDKDVEITFDYHDSGYFHALSGNDITSSDYTVSDNTVTIDYDYIYGMFDDNPDRETLILSYTLYYSEGAVIGYIYIHKPA